MGGHPVPEIPCRICGRFIDLTVDLSADANGRAVHEACYIGQLRRARTTGAVEELLNSLTIQSGNLQCTQCGMALSRASATFCMENGKKWNVPLPVCIYCSPVESLSGAYMA